MFQRGYRSVVVDRDEYLLECGRYIERNPIKAGLSSDPGSYPHSSFGYYSLGQPDPLLEPSPAYLGLADTERDRMLSYWHYVSEERIQETANLNNELPF